MSLAKTEIWQRKKAKSPQFRKPHRGSSCLVLVLLFSQRIQKIRKALLDQTKGPDSPATCYSTAGRATQAATFGQTKVESETVSQIMLEILGHAQAGR